MSETSKEPLEKLTLSEKEYHRLYHRLYYQNNKEYLKKQRNKITFKKTYPYIPIELMDEFKKDKVCYFKLMKKKLNKKILLAILNEFYNE